MPDFSNKLRLQRLLLTVILIIIAVEGFACKCPTRRIELDADKAYDIVAGE